MEQKTILEELIEEAPQQREHRHKITKVKHCISREDWDKAAELMEEILAETPEDEDAIALNCTLKDKRERAMEKQRKEEARAAKHRELLHSKKFLVTMLLVFVVVCAAVAAVLGIYAHRQTISEELADKNIVVTDTFVMTDYNH